MTGIFISYRRTASTAWARSLADRLRAHFGRHKVFLDVDDIYPGADFPQAIVDRILGSEAFLALIDPGWIAAVNEAHERKSDAWSHRELAEALAAGGNVFPVTLDRAVMPGAAQLPSDLKQLARLEAIEISPTDFEASVRKLIVALDPKVSKSLPRRVGVRRGAALLAILVAIAVLVATWAVDFLRERSLRSDASGPVVTYAGVQWEIYEVSNERYALCVQASVCSRPGLSAQETPYDDPARATLPVVSVTAVDAAAFCNWIGRRLPTFGEWKDAATRGGQNAWPWGDTPPTPQTVVADVDRDIEVFSDLTAHEQKVVKGLVEQPTVTFGEIEAIASEHMQTEDIQQVVDAYPTMEPLERRDALVRLFSQGKSPTDVQEITHARDGRTPEGIYSLVGNAAEWSATPIDSMDGHGPVEAWDGTSAAKLQVDGGSFSDIVADLKFEKFGVRSDERKTNVGFRCVDDD